MGEEDSVTRPPLSSLPGALPPPPQSRGHPAPGICPWLFYLVHSGLNMETTGLVKSYLDPARLSSINIQVLEPFRTSPREKRGDFLITGEIRNTPMKTHSRRHGDFKGITHALPYLAFPFIIVYKVTRPWRQKIPLFVHSRCLLSVSR